MFLFLNSPYRYSKSSAEETCLLSKTSQSLTRIFSLRGTNTNVSGHIQREEQVNMHNAFKTVSTMKNW